MRVDACLTLIISGGKPVASAEPDRTSFNVGSYYGCLVAYRLCPYGTGVSRNDRLGEAHDDDAKAGREEDRRWH